jgi:hypothetical protein
MNVVVLTLALLSQFTAAPAPMARGSVVLGRDKEYQALKQIEQTFTGRLRAVDGGFRLFVLDGLGRASNHVDIHAPGKAYLLNPHSEQHVRIVGKVVPGKDGARLWPGSIERPASDRPGLDGVIARTTLPFKVGAATTRTVQCLIAKSGDKLAAQFGLSGPTAGTTVSKLLAPRFGLAVIDWEKQMVVEVDGGLNPCSRSLTIRRAVKEGRSLVVYYAWGKQPSSEAGFHRAGEFALVPRVDGPIVFKEVGAKPRR